jgi:hypothetical protein
MKYRKKPVVIEAWQWNGEDGTHWPKWMHEWSFNGEVLYIIVGTLPTLTTLHIPTLEGRMKANVGDWIIKGVNGEVYPCKPDIFAKTYEVVEA